MGILFLYGKQNWWNQKNQYLKKCCYCQFNTFCCFCFCCNFCAECKLSLVFLFLFVCWTISFDQSSSLQCWFEFLFGHFTFLLRSVFFDESLFFFFFRVLFDNFFVCLIQFFYICTFWTGFSYFYCNIALFCYDFLLCV